MKKITNWVICLVTILLTSCSKDIDVVETLPWIEKNTCWEGFIGQHFTKDSSPNFWEVLDDYYAGYYIRYEDLEDGEYVEFYNITDSCITIRYAREEKKIVDLSEVTNHQLSGIIANPSLPFSFQQSIETKLKFNYETKKSVCYFEGNLEESYNYFTKFTGNIDSKGNLHIRKLGGYISPFPKLRSVSGIAYDYPYRKFYRNWQVPFYKFDTATLKCRQSPILIHWNSTAWNGEISTIIPDIKSAFLKFLGS